MSAMTSMHELAKRQVSRLRAIERENGERFPAGPAVKAWGNENFPCSLGTRGHAVPYADNTTGESIGKRDFDPDAPCSLADAARGGRPEWRRWV